jgi:ribosomal protein S18 acetylase RimI-like enzyme
MTETQVFQVDDSDYIVCRLQPEHTEPLQRLFDQCADYAMIVDGESVSPTAAEEIFHSVPAGRSLSDKFLYGFFNRKGDIVGVLEGIRHYPNDKTWWIGLLMLAPEVRGHGLGRKLIQGFSEYMRSEQGMSIMLGVVEDNRAAYRFWQQLGFEFVRETEPRPFGKKIQTVYVMQKNLTPERVRTKPSISQ